MKKLSIEINNTKLYKSGGYIKVGGTSLETLVSENLPTDMEDYTDYMVNAQITIEFIPNLESIITVNTDGYGLEKEPESEEI